MRSVAIRLPDRDGQRLTFRYYLAHGSNSSADDYLRVTVRDEGVGMEKPSPDPGLGLGRTLIERHAAAALFRSGAAGTTVEMAFPLDVEVEPERLDDGRLAAEEQRVTDLSETADDEVVLLALLRRAAALRRERVRRDAQPARLAGP
jgi:hypothetical protein